MTAQGLGVPAQRDGAMVPSLPLAYEGRQVRVITDEQGMPWFVAADVCAVLEIGNPRQALTRLDDDEKTLISNEGQGRREAPTLNLINESGLYSLILGSRKPEARAFKRWVTHEVLPAIRRTGSYSIPTPTRRRPAQSQSPLPPSRMDDLKVILLSNAPVTTASVLPRLGLPVTRSNQMAVGAALRECGYIKRRVRMPGRLHWVYFPPNWSTAPAVLQSHSLPRGVHVVASTEEEAAQIWCKTLQAQASLAIWAQFRQQPPAGSRLVDVDGYHFHQLSLPA